MNSKTISTGILRALGILLLIALILFFLYKIRAVVVYIILASVVALIGRPVVKFLTVRLKFKITFAVLCTLSLMMGGIVGFLLLFIPLLIQQGQNLALLDINALQNNITLLFENLITHFNWSKSTMEQWLSNINVLDILNLKTIPEMLNSFLSTIGSFGAGFFSVIFISFFFLKDSKLFEQMILTMVPDNKESRVQNSMDTIKNLLSRYFIGLLLQILILFIIYTIVLLIFGIPNAFMIALLCALLNLIPYVGPVIGFFLMTFLTMTSNLGSDFSSIVIPKTIYVMIGFLIGQFIDNNLSQPIIFSKSVKSHPLEIFLIIIIGGFLFGVTGMVVAVPGYTALKVILKEFLAENKIVKSLTKTYSTALNIKNIKLGKYRNL